MWKDDIVMKYMVWSYGYETESLSSCRCVEKF